MVTDRCRSSSLPPDSCLQLFFDFLSRIGFSNPTPRRFSLSVANSRLLSHFSQVNLCTRKSPHEFIRVCTWGIRTHETDLYQAQGHLIRHRGDRLQPYGEVAKLSQKQSENLQPVALMEKRSSHSLFTVFIIPSPIQKNTTSRIQKNTAKSAQAILHFRTKAVQT